jgi:hypothetical protein
MFQASILLNAKLNIVTTASQSTLVTQMYFIYHFTLLKSTLVKYCEPKYAITVK